MDNQKIAITNKEIKLSENRLTKVTATIGFAPVPFQSDSENSAVETPFPTNVKPRKLDELLQRHQALL